MHESICEILLICAKKPCLANIRSYIILWSREKSMQTKAISNNCKRLINIFTLQGEGVAYRGRLLVELETKLGEEIDKELEVMKGPELIRVQVVLNCKRLR